MWGALGTIGSGLMKALGNKGVQKGIELGAGYLGARQQDKGAQAANAMEAGMRNTEILAAPTARRDAIVQDENIAGSQAQAGGLANNMADRTQQQALKMAILSGANMGGVSAPSFLAGKTGNVSGPQWSAEQLAALKGAWDSGNQNVQTSIDSLRARQESPFSKLVFGAAGREDERQKALLDNMQKQALESGVLGESNKPKEPWYKKWLLPAIGAGAAAYGAYKLGGSDKPPINFGSNAGPLGTTSMDMFFKNGVPRAKLQPFTHPEDEY